MLKNDCGPRDIPENILKIAILYTVAGSNPDGSDVRTITERLDFDTPSEDLLYIRDVCCDLVYEGKLVARDYRDIGGSLYFAIPA